MSKEPVAIIAALVAGIQFVLQTYELGEPLEPILSVVSVVLGAWIARKFVTPNVRVRSRKAGV